MRFVSTISCFCVFSVLFIGLNSCGSSKESTKRPLDKSEVSRILKMNITRGDNLSLYKEVVYWLNMPHRDAGATNLGIDCSYFVGMIYKQVYNIKLERSSNDMLNRNCRKISRSRLEEGDLVFFDTQRSGRNQVSHVGVYLKDGKFAHTSTSKGVMVSSLDESFYQKTWVCGGRVR